MPEFWNITVGGRHYRDYPAPLQEVEALLEARSLHPGWSAFKHLLGLASLDSITTSSTPSASSRPASAMTSRARAGTSSTRDARRPPSRSGGSRVHICLRLRDVDPRHPLAPELVVLVLHQLRGNLPFLVLPTRGLLSLTREQGLAARGPRSSGSRPRMVTVVLKGDKRRPSGQGPGTRVRNGLASHKSPGLTGSPLPSSQPASPARPDRPRTPQTRQQVRATKRQRPAPGSHPQPRTKFSGQRDRPRRAGLEPLHEATPIHRISRTEIKEPEQTSLTGYAQRTEIMFRRVLTTSADRNGRTATRRRRPGPA